MGPDQDNNSVVITKASGICSPLSTQSLSLSLTHTHRVYISVLVLKHDVIVKHHERKKYNVALANALSLVTMLRLR